MAVAKYTYSIINDFPSSKVDLLRLTFEINSSDITPSLDYINTNGDDCDIYFIDSTSLIDTTALNTIVFAHGGSPIPPLISEYIVTAGEDVGSKKAVYLSGSDEVKLACANLESTVPCVGFTSTSALQGEEFKIFANDVLSGFSGLTPGGEYFLSQDSTASGEITTIKPTTGIVISVGIAKSSTELDIHIFRRALETFGGYYQVEESNSVSAITGTTGFQQKLRLNVTELPIGNYRLSWQYDWMYSKDRSKNDFRVRIEMDDSSSVRTVSQESNSANKEYNESGYVILKDFSGSHYFDLDFGTNKSRYTAKLYNAKLEIWRVE